MIKPLRLGYKKSILILLVKLPCLNRFFAYLFFSRQMVFTISSGEPKRFARASPWWCLSALSRTISCRSSSWFCKGLSMRSLSYFTHYIIEKAEGKAALYGE